MKLTDIENPARGRPRPLVADMRWFAKPGPESAAFEYTVLT
jgi:hypothetical protein